uniref:Si:ch73-54f23.2 n=1 Tax=Gasterosteus aculeatus aculeatus TaxID=481459 RepID=G3P511_GASAC
MLRPAGVGAAVWLLAALGPGLSLPAEDSSLCTHCFYRQTPPQGASAGLLCHSLPGGRMFATMLKATCDTAVFSAFHLGHGWTEREGKGLTSKEEKNIKSAVPALLRGGKHPSHPASPTDSPLHHWDSTVTTLVKSSISPQCSTLGGDLYILTGVGGLGAAEDGHEKCQTRPLWSAVCCALPEGKSGFSMGLIRETAEGERQLSVKELGEILGVAELFSEGCGGADGATAGVRVGLRSEGLPGNVEKLDADHTGENTGVEGVDSKTEAGQVAEGEEVGSEAAERIDLRDVTRSGAVRLASPESADYETADEQETDNNSVFNVLMYVLSTTVSILKAPLQPVVSTVTKLPGQVTYVLQEDLEVLSAIPGETFSLLHLLTSDLLYWTGSAGETLLGIGEDCCSSIYYCVSSMLEALLNSCHTGVTGIGTLAGDSVGIFCGALDNVWWVTEFFGGQLWEQGEAYVGTVVSEMGGQVQAVGGGFGRLASRSGIGVGNVFKIGGGLVLGIVDTVFGAGKMAFE